MKKKNKGFTLIELLAVIVILGLLMAIAIPSVTKYITESRKKTVTSTIGNYITATVNEVNDLTYTFTNSNTIYAVPIECISLERGGTNPFGAWHQANDAYWAYVLVQYDDETSSYRYGYTFKDSAGYGLYPTAQSKLNEQGKQIKTGLDLSRPKNGNVTNITEVKNWSGFDVNATTSLVVLEATSEGEVGDGKTTCTLCQKGDNYAQVEQEKDNKKEENNGGEVVSPPVDETPEEKPDTSIGDSATADIYVTRGDYTITIEFKEGITWGEFMNNQHLFYYNNYQFYTFGSELNYSIGVSTYPMYLNDVGVFANDKIVNGGQYVTGTTHVGGTN